MSSQGCPPTFREERWLEGGDPVIVTEVSGDIKVFLELLDFYSKSESRQRAHESPRGSPRYLGWDWPAWSPCWGQSIVWDPIHGHSWLSLGPGLSTWYTTGKASGSGGSRTQQTLWGPLWGVLTALTPRPLLT